jgi:DnaJ-class molecular chaperone
MTAPAPCHVCHGDGGWTDTVEGTNGRDEDTDVQCPACDGTGEEQ